MMDLSKAFDCLPHDLLIAKVAAYGFNHNTVELIHSYLKNRKQFVRINGYHSLLKPLISGVPQGSILGPILFKIFLNDLFYFISSENLHNFANDNTVSDSAETITELTARLENLTGHAMDWLNENQMIANPSKFHAIILKKDQTDASGTSLSVKDHVLSTETEVNLLGITIDYRPSFGTHIGNLCKKAERQINALKRLSSFLNQSSKHTMVNSFIIANFNYCPVIWHFCKCKKIQRIEKIRERALRFVYSDYTSTYPVTREELLLYNGSKTPQGHLS